jgi:DNA polymerase III delta prime subunit
MTETFMTKYKPYFLTDFAEPELIKVVRTLFSMDDLNILLVGSIGCGKTCMLNALIREYYGLSKISSFSETNIMFINNLKEQGINYYRNEMKTFCQSQCSIYGKKKLIVVDDLDNINEQSQQVFRNYLDKYKHNVHFLAVCTNVQKVIESIQSRVHILQIPTPSADHVRRLMDTIVATESIDLDDEAKQTLMQLSNNSFRLMINYLEKIHIYGEPVHGALCLRMCSNHCFQHFDRYVAEPDLNAAIQILYDIYDEGYSVIDILDFFFAYLKTSTLLDEDQKYRMVPILCKYITVFNKVHEDVIELALFTNEIASI